MHRDYLITFLQHFKSVVSTAQKPNARQAKRNKFEILRCKIPAVSQIPLIFAIRSRLIVLSASLLTSS